MKKINIQKALNKAEKQISGALKRLAQRSPTPFVSVRESKLYKINVLWKESVMETPLSELNDAIKGRPIQCNKKTLNLRKGQAFICPSWYPSGCVIR